MSRTTFDGANKFILLDEVSAVTVEDIYSDWKRWVRFADNAKFPLAFDTTGGDAVGADTEVAPYFFCRNDNGWRIKMPQQDGEIVVTGNLFPRNSEEGMFIQYEGFDAFLRLEVSTRAVVIRVPVPAERGVSALTAAQDAKLDNIIQVKAATNLIAALL